MTPRRRLADAARRRLINGVGRKLTRGSPRAQSTTSKLQVPLTSSPRRMLPPCIRRIQLWRALNPRPHPSSNPEPSDEEGPWNDPEHASPGA